MNLIGIIIVSLKQPNSICTKRAEDNREVRRLVVAIEVKAWALVNVETDDGQYTVRGEPFIIFSFAGTNTVSVEPRLQVFDVRHREYAERKREEWSRVFPDCKVVPCTIVLGDVGHGFSSFQYGYYSKEKLK